MIRHTKSGCIRPSMLFFLFLSVLIICTACGKKETAPDARKEYRLLRTTELQADGDSSFRSIQFAGDSIFCGSYSGPETGADGLSTETIFRFSKSGELTDKLTLPLGTSRDVVQWFVDDAGNIYITAQDADTVSNKGGLSLRLYQFDAEGALCFQRDFQQSEKYPVPNNQVSDVAADAEGRICLLLYDTVLLFDAEGNFRGEAEVREYSPYALVPGADGTVCLFCRTKENQFVFARVNPDAGKVETLYTGLNQPSGGAAAYSDTGLLFSTEEGPCLFDGMNKEPSILFSWLSQDLLYSSVRALSLTEEGTLLTAVIERNDSGGFSARLMEFGDAPAKTDSVSNETSSTGIVSPEDASSAQVTEDGKTILTLAAIMLTFQEKDTILEFNRNSAEYRIEVVEYLPYGWNTPEELEDARTKLEMEAALDSKGFDIISLDYLHVENLAQKGVLENLYPFLDQDGGFERQDFFEGILNAYTLGDRLISIPNEISVEVLVGKESDLGDKHGWTLAELLDYGSSHPEAVRLFTDRFQTVAASRILLNGNDNFIRMEGGEVLFDQEVCENVLKLIKAHKDIDSDIPTAVRLQQGESLLTAAYLHSFDGLQLDRARFGEPVTWIGYPDQSGASSVLFEGQTEYAISSKSDCKDGAWEYLEFCLHKDPQFRFSPQKSVFEEQARRALTEQYMTDTDGNILLDADGVPQLKSVSTYHEGSGDNEWIFTRTPVTQEDVETLRQIMQSGGRAWLNPTNQVIYEAVLEEGAAYFSGQKPLDMVTDILKNRITLYLQEQ